MAFLIKLDQLIFPKVSPQANKLFALLSRDTPEFSEIDDLVLQDPVLAGTLLRYANSPLYQRGKTISNIPTATRLIGFKNVRSAVMRAILQASCPSDNSLSKTILAHSLAVALLSKLIARSSCSHLADDLELMGLIHGIGMMILAINLEAEYAALIEQSQLEKIALDVLEKEHFGFNHDQITVKALNEFRLPQQHMMVLIQFHQMDVGELDEDMAKARAILILAHYLLAEIEEREEGRVEGNAGFVEPLSGTVDTLCQQLDIDTATLAGLREQAGRLELAVEN